MNIYILGVSNINNLMFDLVFLSTQNNVCVQNIAFSTTSCILGLLSSLGPKTRGFIPVNKFHRRLPSQIVVIRISPSLDSTDLYLPLPLVKTPLVPSHLLSFSLFDTYIKSKGF